MNNDKLLTLNLITDEITNEKEEDINTKHIEDVIMLIRYEDESTELFKGELFTDIKIEHMHTKSLSDII